MFFLVNLEQHQNLGDKNLGSIGIKDWASMHVPYVASIVLKQ